VSYDDLDAPGATFPPVAAGLHASASPLGSLPRLAARQIRLESRLDRLGGASGLRYAFGWISPALSETVEARRPEILWRPSGLRRTGLVAQFSWPRLSTRLGLGIETPLAHLLVDRLLGFERIAEESRLPLSPVEWGILTFAVAESLDRLTSAQPCPVGAWDLTIDRVGPDPFDADGLGRVLTLRWLVELGATKGSVRLWLPETLVSRWLAAEPAPTDDRKTGSQVRFLSLISVWKAEAGRVDLPRGLKTLRTGGVLPLVESRLTGSPESPAGVVDLALVLSGQGGRYHVETTPEPLSGAGRLKVTGPLRHSPWPREPVALNPTTPHETSAQGGDVPVTLVVELGRVNLTLRRVADLKPGDVVELGRHAREPIELTSGGRLVARGELVQIDTELGVRITHVYL
jgi:type III secretion system YscQ/HrcQ family protein